MSQSDDEKEIQMLRAIVRKQSDSLQEASKRIQELEAMIYILKRKEDPTHPLVYQ